MRARDPGGKCGKAYRHKVDLPGVYRRRVSRRGAYRFLQAAIATIAIVGCATMAAHKASDYDRGNVSEDKMTKDVDSCAKQAEAHTKEYGMGPYDPTHGSYNFMFDSCMQAGGYQRKKI
jgi:hypothetical protein